MRLRKFLNKYFWDVDLSNLEVKSHSAFIIGRILEHGDADAIKWMLENFNRSQIKQTLLKRRDFSRKSANYWSTFFNIPKNQVLCLNKSYQKMQKSHWPY